MKIHQPLIKFPIQGLPEGGTFLKPVHLLQIDEFIPGSKPKLQMIGTEIGKALTWFWNFLCDFCQFYAEVIYNIVTKSFFALRDTMR